MHEAAGADAGFEDVGDESEFPEGQLRGVRMDDEPVVIARCDGQLFAMDGVCTHMSVLLEEGDLDGCAVRCPRHFATFDLRTGVALEPPAQGRLTTYQVRVDGGRVLVARGPRVETP